jgi:TolB protein
MMRAWVMIVVVLAGWSGLERSAAAQVRGTIFGPGARSYPIAVSPLRNLSSGGAGAGVGTHFAEVLERDLTIAGLFKVIDRAAFLEKPEASGYTVDSINFDNWSVLGALALVKGAYTIEGDTLTLEVRLFDVYQRRQLTGRRYHGSLDEVRRMANRFADEIMQQFTGERGPFDSRIAFVSTRDSRFKEVYVMSPDGGDLRQITRDQTLALSPSWSPNNETLYYTSYKRGNPDLYSISLLNNRDTVISKRKGLNLGGRPSPDGSKLAVTLETDGNADIVLMNTSGNILQRLTDTWAIDVSPSWSPDGSQIAFCSNRSGSPQIYVVAATGGDPRRITFSGSYNTSPAWSPKGDRIAYVNRSDGQFNIFTVKVDGSDARQLTQGVGNNEDPSWAPDGRYLVFSSSRTGHKKLFVTDATGVAQVELTRGGGDDTSPAWSRWLE